MIWYVLYPIRGTTEAPVLASSNPIRDGLARYGRYAARHATTSLLISVAVATILIYPIPFLFTTDFINGASILPHHAWTVAQPLPYGTPAKPDVIMRSAWVHASYMQALDANVLASALDLQDTLLGPTVDFHPQGVPTPSHPEDDSALSTRRRDSFHVANGLTDQSWFFHSPLQYWGCAKERVLADADVVSTVNRMKNLSTSANITLRHSIVFSGKRFEDRRLVAADALVVTLLHLRNSPVGEHWEKMARMSPAKFGDKWDIYPPNGQVSVNNRLYEFRFRPISTQDTISLCLAYGLTVVYFLASLSKLRAVKSKIGLIVTVLTQIAFSVMSSFTVCAVFNIDLSRIPRAAYPLTILAMSLENIFRLINAVILTPSGDSTSSRIGQALGKTGPTSMASSAQNVVILLGLSRLVSPGVSAFCIFAAVAIIIDLFYLMTFFLAVLSVDVRRMELSDALAKSTEQDHGVASELRNRPTWLKLVFQGRTALSTRIAGTIVMVGFVLMAQWHFFDDRTAFRSFLGLWPSTPPHDPDHSNDSFLEGIHQARSHASWLRLQDHETAQEVIHILNPAAHSYVARVYDPLVFVLKGADRMPKTSEPTLLPAAYDFINHQSTRFVVIVVVVVAAIRLLASYLLLEEEAGLDQELHIDPPPLLNVQSFPNGHSLDVALLGTSKGDLVVSGAFDRTVRVWDMHGNGSTYAIPFGTRIECSSFPILSFAIDRWGTWLAFLSAGHVMTWNLNERSWGPTVEFTDRGARTELFDFVPDIDGILPELIMVQRDGFLTDLSLKLGEGSQRKRICLDTPICVRPHSDKAGDSASIRFSIVILTVSNEVFVASRHGKSWAVQQPTLGWNDEEAVEQIESLSPWPLLVFAGKTSVRLVRSDDWSPIRTFSVPPLAPGSLRCALICDASDFQDYRRLSLGYTHRTTGDCVSQSYCWAIHGDGRQRQSKTTVTEISHLASAEIRTEIRLVSNPGTWEMLADGRLVGIRERRQKEGCSQGSTRTHSGLRRRLPEQSLCQDAPTEWEFWTTSPPDRPEADECRPLLKSGEARARLVISEVGPSRTLGKSSVAFGFGTAVEVVTISSHGRLDGTLEPPSGSRVVVSSRRRRAAASHSSLQWTGTI